ncbi:MAG: O-succinylbenzoic acid--CoA ligase [Arcticibacterium sp.]|jgi:O-succinylbenzoic acid--CoA ligase
MIYVSREKELVNYQPQNDYFEKVKDFVLLWESGVQTLEVQTSGSTGEAKIIKLNRNQILASVEQTKNAFHLNEEHLFICNLSINHIAGKLMIIRALTLNSELIVIHPEGDFIKNLGNQTYLLHRNAGKVFFAFVPLQLEKILRTSDGYDILHKAKAIIVGGAAVNSHLLQKIKDLKVPVYATYGMTETVTHVAIKKLNGTEPDPYFTVLEGTEIRLNKLACLVVKNTATDNKWLDTNDLTKLITDKSFSLLGRLDNVINSGGLKLNLDLIEHKIDSILSHNIPFFCFGLPDEHLGQKLVLCLESDRKDTTILGQLKNQMPKFNSPKEVLVFKKFERTLSGKIDKTKTINASSISD